MCVYICMYACMYVYMSQAQNTGQGKDNVVRV